MKNFTLYSLAVAAMLFMPHTTFAAGDEAVINTVVFVKADGAVVENGSEVTGNEVTEDPFQGNKVETDLKLKNVSDANVNFSVEYDIMSMDNGYHQTCLNGACSQPETSGTGESNIGVLRPGAEVDLQSEWFAENYGTAKVLYRIKIYKYIGLDETGFFPQYEFLGNGSEVTVNYVYADPTGINGVTGGGTEVKSTYFDTAGRKVNNPSNGMFIKKSVDAQGNVTAEKVIIK